VLAVDAGTHLAAIVRILEESLSQRPFSEAPKGPTATNERRNSSNGTNAALSDPSPPHSSARIYRSEVGKFRATSVVPTQRTGSKREEPFAGLELPHKSARANAAYITREMISTYLITHPHLDHISGFVVNTASFQQTSRPKRLAGLPSTIHAIKTHIFNDVIWPNLSDEDGGVGLVSYMRLTEGGNVALGDGDGRGYIEVCDGLSVKSLSVSHGHCMKTHSHRGSSAGLQAGVITAAIATAAQEPLSPGPDSDRAVVARARALEKPCVYDSTAFFVKDQSSGREVLIFGDVEPDSLSLSPRTASVWAEAAPKIAAGTLPGIFIECSFDDTQSDPTLFGHLAPRHLIDELKVLAAKVEACRQAKRKRKRQSIGLKFSHDSEIRYRRARNPHRNARRGQDRGLGTPDSTQADSDRTNESIDDCVPPGVLPEGTLGNSDEPPKTGYATSSPSTRGGGGGGGGGSSSSRPLEGLTIFIIHMKDTLKDGQDVGVDILECLHKHDLEVGLGCNFIISRTGASFWL
jgi:cAMP phosphodiesterase